MLLRSDHCMLKRLKRPQTNNLFSLHQGVVGFGHFHGPLTEVLRHFVTGCAWPLLQVYPVGVSGLKQPFPGMQHKILVSHCWWVAARAWPAKELINTTATAIDLRMMNSSESSVYYQRTLDNWRGQVASFFVAANSASIFG